MKCEIAVIGGGIAGVSAAFFLAQRGCDVRLVERSTVAGGATGRSGGLLLEPLHHPELRELWTANRDLIRGIGIPCGFVQRGSLRDGAFVAGDAEFDPSAFVLGLADRIRPRILEQTRCVRLQGSTIRTTAEPVEAEMVLIATDAFAPQVHKFFEEVIAPIRAQALLTEPAAPCLPMPEVRGKGMDFLRRLPDGRILAWGGRHVDPNREYTVAEKTTDPIQNHLDELVRPYGARVERRWAGIQGFTCDDLPCVGPIPGAVNQYACLGWNGIGLGLAVVCAKIVSEMMLDGKTLQPCEALSLRRHI